MQKNFLAKWLANELTEEELSTFKKSEEYASYEKIRKATEVLKVPDFDVEKALNASKFKRSSKQPKVLSLNPIKKIFRIAAAVLLLISGGYFYFNNLNERIETGYAENTSFLLPDSSEVLLNDASEVSYDKKKWEHHRNLKLRGEAFFKVAKGKKFTVTTDMGSVEVLGTQFNVKSREDFFEVNCFEGVVRVTFQGKAMQLPAGNSFLMVNGQTIPDPMDIGSEPSWVKEESTFKSIPLKFVLKEFERQFNISFELKNIDTDKAFTGSFNHHDITLALQSICAPNQIKFNLEGTKVLLYAESTP